MPNERTDLIASLIAWYMFIFLVSLPPTKFPDGALPGAASAKVIPGARNACSRVLRMNADLATVGIEPPAWGGSAAGRLSAAAVVLVRR